MSVNLVSRDHFNICSIFLDKGVVFYLRNENVVGVVTWNIFGKMGVARRLLAHKSDELDFAEMARLFNVHK